jgi:hypothetical protein
MDAAWHCRWRVPVIFYRLRLKIQQIIERYFKYFGEGSMDIYEC